MHPHWHAASPDIQRKLISLYILSLAPKSPITTLSPTSDSPASAFDSELRYARSSHDIAAVLRWGLRHLKLESNSFGESSSSDEWHWYYSFYEAERTASYSPNSFSNNLIPRLPPAHANLLISTLDVISSLAAHAETNGFSGSRLSKFFGLWLLSVRRSSDTDDWNSFYSRWESAGRVMEHLFLSWLRFVFINSSSLPHSLIRCVHARDEATKHQMPKRLLELVDHYPFSSSPSTNDGFLPRSRFSTRQYDALFVRVETVIPNSVKIKTRQHPLRLINDALKSETTLELGEHLAAWKELRELAAAGSDVDDESWAPVLTRIFADDTIGLLALVPADTDAGPTFTLQLPSRPALPNRRRSMSLGSVPNGRAVAKAPINGNNTSAVANGLHKSPAAFPAAAPESPKNWDEFSAAGFSELNISRDFASTLLDTDIEVTNPPPLRKASKKKTRRPSPLRRYTRSSLDIPATAHPTSYPSSEAPPLPIVITKSTSITLIKLDEAFVDFWSDALLDPVSYNWPKFVICQLRRPLEVTGGGKAVNWIVIEQIFTRPPPEVRTASLSPEYAVKTAGVPLKRTISPRSSLAASSFTAAVRRFSLFGGSQDGKDVVKRKSSDGPKSPKIGELGEILSEEPEEREVGFTNKDGTIGAVASSVTANAVPTSVAGVRELEHKRPNGVSNVGMVPQLEPVTLSDAFNAIPTRKDEASHEQAVSNVLQTSPVEPIASSLDVELVANTSADTAKKAPSVFEPFVGSTSFVVGGNISAPVDPPAGDRVKISSTNPELQDTKALLYVDSGTTVTNVYQVQPEPILPLAPETVVKSGETPGPQLSLDSTERPVLGVAEIESSPQPTEKAKDVLVNEVVDFNPPSSTPVAIESLPQEMGLESTGGVDLEEVPIVSMGLANAPPKVGTEGIEPEVIDEGIAPDVVGEGIAPEVVNEGIEVPELSDVVDTASAAEPPQDASIIAPSPSELPAPDEHVVEGVDVNVTPSHEDQDDTQEGVDGVHSSGDVIVAHVEEIAPPASESISLAASSIPTTMDDDSHATMVLEPVSSSPPVESENLLIEEEPAVQTTVIVPDTLQTTEPAHDVTTTVLAQEPEQEVEPNSTPTTNDADPPALEAETDLPETEGWLMINIKFNLSISQSPIHYNYSYLQYRRRGS
jgi:Domain of unknown function (DUF1708)